MPNFDDFAPFDVGAGSNVREATWRKFMRHVLRDGVLAGVGSELAVTFNTGTTVNVATGEAFVQGHWGESTAVKSVVHDAHHATLPRWDRVIVEADFAGNAVRLDKLSGTPAASPVAPALTQGTAKWQVSLATVKWPATSGAPTIVDERGFLLRDGGPAFADKGARDLWVPATTALDGLVAYRRDVDLFDHIVAGSWVPLSGQLIERQVLSAAAATVTFSSLPQDFRSLYFEIAAQTSEALDGVAMFLRFNASATDDYYDLVHFATGSAGGAIAVGNPRAGGVGFVGDVPGSNAANRLGNNSLLILNYAQAAKAIAWRSTGGSIVGAAASWRIHDTWGTWVPATLAAITSIRFSLAGTGNFVSGSVFSLYGRR